MTYPNETAAKPSSTRAAMTLFFDGQCPLCSAEMRELERLDCFGLLNLVDLHREDFAQLYPHVDPEKAISILQAQLSDGSMLFGIDANVKAWQLVGKKKWLQILRWPLVRVIADLAYLFFARNRSLISFLLTGQKRCNVCVSGELDK
ncbi:MAG: thiol-disulfide oxidoreductase [Pseudohongiella sp.]|nr:MAG: thiol-disulfide oxidoreductase [Pseudohongiella sp.]